MQSIGITTALEVTLKLHFLLLAPDSSTPLTTGRVMLSIVLWSVTLGSSFTTTHGQTLWNTLFIFKKKAGTKQTLTGHFIRNTCMLKPTPVSFNKAQKGLLLSHITKATWMLSYWCRPVVCNWWVRTLKWGYITLLYCNNEYISMFSPYFNSFISFPWEIKAAFPMTVQQLFRISWKMTKNVQVITGNWVKYVSLYILFHLRSKQAPFFSDI